MHAGTNRTALKIGKVIEEARIGHGYTSRQSFVDTRRLKGTITQEGLRKIEKGERIPRLENLRRIGQTLGINDRRMKELEELALRENVKRVAKKSDRQVVLHISGKPMVVNPLPPKKKHEDVTRRAVDRIVEATVDKYGVLPEDIEHFRRYARAIILEELKSA